MTRWIIIDLDYDELATTIMYHSYDEAKQATASLPHDNTLEIEVQVVDEP